MPKKPEPLVMETTHEQRMAVLRDQCRTDGHMFDYILVVAALSPRRLFCRRCGSAWRIHPDDSGMEFPGLEKATR
jgi:hypothetical protein